MEEGLDPLEPAFSHVPSQNGLVEPDVISWVGSPHPSRTVPDSKSVDNEEEEEEMYKPRGQTQEEQSISDQ